MSYHDAGILGDEELAIDLAARVTLADVADLWCNVLAPIGAATPVTTFYGGPYSNDGWRPLESIGSP